jgi:hypothetical protein
VGVSTGVVLRVASAASGGGHRDLPAGGDKRLPGRRLTSLRNVARARSSRYKYPSIGVALRGCDVRAYEFLVAFDERAHLPDMLDMWVIYMDISAGQGGLSSVEMEARRGGCRSMFDSVC